MGEYPKDFWGVADCCFKRKSQPDWQKLWTLRQYQHGGHPLLFTTNAGWKSFDAKTAVTDGDWHHVAGTYDGSDFKLYLNGQVDAQVSPGTKPDTSDNLLFIGGCDIGNYWMTGVIDEVVLYDRSLSEKEINELIEDGMVVTLDVQPGGKLVTTWSQIKAQAAR